MAPPPDGAAERRLQPLQPAPRLAEYAVRPARMPAQEPLLNQLNLVVRDMEAALAFYRMLGVELRVAPGGQHAAASLAGVSLELDTTEFVPHWDSGWQGATGGSAVLGFTLASREAVDDLYARLTAAGHRGHQRPYDAFWGARYAIVDDPDGNGVGLMSPIEESRKSWPPQPPPSGP